MSLDAVLDRAFAPLQAAVAAKRIPGGVLGVVDRDGTRAVRSIGSAQLVPAERPMTDNTWFDLASLTKVIFTTPRILELAAAGTIDLDAPLTSVIPDLRQYNPDNSWEPWVRRGARQHRADAHRAVAAPHPWLGTPL